MKGRAIQIVFWALVAVFIAMIVMVFVDTYMVGPVIFPFWGIIFLLGIALIVLTARERPAGALKTLLLMTGAAAGGLPLFVVLHNLTAGLLNVEEPVFFILAVIVCPLGFLIGAVGSIVLSLKHRQPVSGT